MKTKLPVIPFIETTHQNKGLFNQKFIPEMLGNSLGRKPMQVRGFTESNETHDGRLSKWEEQEAFLLFEGWAGKTRKWIEMKNDDGDKIEFYAKTYKINGTELPYPQTVDQFITDCKRLNVNLFWHRDLIELGLNPLEILDEQTSKELVNELLTIMDKI